MTMRGLNMGGSLKSEVEFTDNETRWQIDRWRRAQDEFDRIRKTIPERADFHLNNWGLWRRADQFTTGFKTKSPCFETAGGCAAVESSDHLWERNLGRWAEVSDVVICGLSNRQQIAIRNMYESSVYRCLRLDLEKELKEAAEAFWAVATKHGLV